MTTVKNKVFIAISHENFYLVGRELTSANFWLVGRLTSIPTRENPILIYINIYIYIYIYLYIYIYIYTIIGKKTY